MAAFPIQLSPEDGEETIAEMVADLLGRPEKASKITARHHPCRGLKAYDAAPLPGREAREFLRAPLMVDQQLADGAITPLAGRLPRSLANYLASQEI